MDLVSAISYRNRTRAMIGTKTDFVWIEAHPGDLGIEAADRLATKGSKYVHPIPKEHIDLYVKLCFGVELIEHRRAWDLRKRMQMADKRDTNCAKTAAPNLSAVRAATKRKTTPVE